jgi:hypothetical protein
VRRPDGAIETAGGLVWIYPDAERPSVRWSCPGCFRVGYGRLGPEPMIGGADPIYAMSGSDDAPSLEPPLICPAGHLFVLRDGKLGPA